MRQAPRTRKPGWRIRKAGSLRDQASARQEIPIRRRQGGIPTNPSLPAIAMGWVDFATPYSRGGYPLTDFEIAPLW